MLELYNEGEEGAPIVETITKCSYFSESKSLTRFQGKRRHLLSLWARFSLHLGMMCWTPWASHGPLACLLSCFISLPFFLIAALERQYKNKYDP